MIFKVTKKILRHHINTLYYVFQMKRSATTHTFERSISSSTLEENFIKYKRDINDLKRETSTNLKLLKVESKLNTINKCPQKQQLLESIEKLIDDTTLVEKYSEIIVEVAHNYDFRDVKANGYRSFLIICNKCCLVLLNQIRSLNGQSSVKWSKTAIQDIIYFVECWHELSRCLFFLTCMIKLNEPTSLFSVDDILYKPEVQRLIDDTDLLRQDIFYGHCLGFQYCNSAQRIFQILSSFMSGYAHSFISQKSGVRAVVNTVIQSVSCFWNPEVRGQLMSSITKHATVEFTKQFWNLGEHPLVLEAPNMILPPVDVAVNFDLPPVPFSVLGKHDRKGAANVTISPPTYSTESQSSKNPSDFNIKLRLTSFRVREGLNWIHNFDKAKSVTDVVNGSNWKDSSWETNDWFSNLFATKNTSNKDMTTGKYPFGRKQTYKERSKRLMIHCHGGGFVAQSAKAHDVYIRVWAEKLDCPILSIDYSLAPERPYPAALQECHYVISWALRNRRQLGCTADAKVVLCGDSAGANLALCATLLGLKNGVAVPDGLFLAYIPTLVNMTPSPARLMSSLDPLLPVGVLARCLLAYVGINEAELIESLKGSECEKSSADLKNDTVIESAKGSENEERNSTLAKVTDSVRPLNIVRKANIPRDPFISPLLAEDSLLAQLPPVAVIGTTLDPLLDDCVELCKLLDKVGVTVDLEVLHDIPHGFLNFVLLSRECDIGSQACLRLIEKLFSSSPLLDID